MRRSAPSGESQPTDPALGVAIKREHDLLNAGKEQIYADMKSADGMKVVQAMDVAKTCGIEKLGILHRH